MTRKVPYCVAHVLYKVFEHFRASEVSLEDSAKIARFNRWSTIVLLQEESEQKLRVYEGAFYLGTEDLPLLGIEFSPPNTLTFERRRLVYVPSRVHEPELYALVAYCHVQYAACDDCVPGGVQTMLLRAPISRVPQPID